jgi:hypothetical protein
VGPGDNDARDGHIGHLSGNTGVIMIHSHYRTDKA